VVLKRKAFPGTERGVHAISGGHAGRWQTDRSTRSDGKASSDIPALKPYWGKLTVRNFREGDGNVGIIRSPLRAIALPDQSIKVFLSVYCQSCQLTGTDRILIGERGQPRGVAPKLL